MKSCIFGQYWVALIGLIIPAIAHAESINVQEFSPPASVRYTWTEGAARDSTAVPGCSRTLFGVTYDYLHDALVELNLERDQRRTVLVNGLQSLQLQGGWDSGHDLSVHLNVPLHVVHRPDVSARTALGDVRLFGKWRGLSRLLPFELAIVPQLKVPTGNEELFLSEGGTPAWGLLVAAEKDFGVLSVAANLGYLHAGGATFRNIYYKQKMPISVGLAIPFAERWWANLEGTAHIVLPFNRYQNPSEIYGGVKRKLGETTVASLGAGTGTFGGVGSADWRVIVGLKAAFPCGACGKAESPVAPQPEVVKSDPRVVFTPNEIRLNEEVRFEHGSATLAQGGRELLDEVAKVIHEHDLDFKHIQIEGHTNHIGSDAYNLKLSKGRAAAVREHLLSKGIGSDRISSEGYGERRPKGRPPGVSKERMLEIDRRVEFKVQH